MQNTTVYLVCSLYIHGELYVTVFSDTCLDCAWVQAVNYEDLSIDFLRHVTRAVYFHTVCEPQE
jgi:hypothetical protein